MISSITKLILLAVVCLTCQATQTSSFDNLVMSYGDFERCSFGLCRHEAKIPEASKHPHSVRAIKKTTGGGQRKRNTKKFANLPSKCEVETNLQCGAKDHPYGWGMF